MTIFFRRLMSVLVLEPLAFEDIESDRHAGMQSVAVVLLVCAAAGVAAMNLGIAGVGTFAAGTIVALSAWLIWITVVTLIGTHSLRETGTRSSTEELLRTLGFAAAPGVFLVFAAFRSAAPLVLVLVGTWMIAAEVVATRQALDYRSTLRALAVAILGWVVAVAVIIGVSALFTTPVE
jgi:hypothetical protein